MHVTNKICCNYFKSSASAYYNVSSRVVVFFSVVMNGTSVVVFVYCVSMNVLFRPLASAASYSVHAAQGGSEKLGCLARLLSLVESFYNLDVYLQRRLQDATDYCCAL